MEGVEKFVFFVGYPRSGHSIIGSVMDAHPDIVIAHEYFLFSECASQLKVGASIFENKIQLFNELYKTVTFPPSVAGEVIAIQAKATTWMLEVSGKAHSVS